MDIKKAVEKQLTALLKDNAEPSEGRMKLLKLGIAYLAVTAKLNENEYGEFFGKDDEPGDAGGVPKQSGGAKPDGGGRKKRSNGAAGEPTGEGDLLGGERT